MNRALHSEACRAIVRRSLWMAAAVLLFVFSSAGFQKPAEEQGVGECACPKEIETRQELARPQEGWVRRDASRMPERWHSVAFYDGDPRHGGAEVMPKISPVVNNAFTQTWAFGKRQSGHKIWMACRYAGTSVKLLRPVADNVSECSGQFRNPHSPSAKAVSCR